MSAEEEGGERSGEEDVEERWVFSELAQVPGAPSSSNDSEEGLSANEIDEEQLSTNLALSEFDLAFSAAPLRASWDDYVDGEGDLEPPRKRARRGHLDAEVDVPGSSSEPPSATNLPSDISHSVVGGVGDFTIHMAASVASPLSLAGAQVWRGAMLLCDFLIHYAESLCNVGLFKAALELGCGTGLVSLVASRCGIERCWATDYHTAVLRLAARNAATNLLHSQVAARVLDWTQPLTPFPKSLLAQQAAGNGDELGQAATVNDGTVTWSSTEIALLQQTTIMLAADVLYDEAVAENFEAVLRALWSCGAIAPSVPLLLALERRVVFTIATMADCSPALDAFFARLQILPPMAAADWCAAHSGALPSAVRQLEGSGTTSLPPALSGRRLVVDFGRHCEYGRDAQLELWEVRPFGLAPGVSRS